MMSKWLSAWIDVLTPFQEMKSSQAHVKGDKYKFIHSFED